MQRLINAIDKATRAGAYTLEETAQILQAIDQVSAVVQQHNELMAKKKKDEAEAQAKAQAKAQEDAKLAESPKLAKVEETK